MLAVAAPAQAQQVVDGPQPWPPNQTVVPPPSSSGDWGAAGGETWTFPGFDHATLADLWWGSAGTFIVPDPHEVRMGFHGLDPENDQMTYMNLLSDPAGGIARYVGWTWLPGDTSYTYCTRFTLTITELDGSPKTAGGEADFPWAHLVPGEGFKGNLLFEAANSPNPADPAACSSGSPSWAPAETFYDAIPSKPMGSAFSASFENGFRWSGRIPEVASPAVSNIRQYAVTVSGTVDFNGWGGRVDLEFGPTTAYGREAQPIELNNDNREPQAFQFEQDGLTPGTTFHYRVTARNEWTQHSGPVEGADHTFTTATPGSSGGGPPGGGAPDTLAPLVEIRFFDTKLGAALRKGLSGTTDSSEAADWAGTLTIDSKALRASAARRVAVATGSGRFNAGTNRFQLKFKKKAARKLRRLKRVKLTLSMKVTDLAGNSRTAKKKLTLRR